MASSNYHEASAEPNLVPILDMVFQLITFFMLVINFRGAQLDMNLKLPVIGSARPVDTKGQTDLLVLNIAADGALTVYGAPRDIDSYVAAEAQASLLAARQENPNSSRATICPRPSSSAPIAQPPFACSIASSKRANSKAFATSRSRP